MFQVTDTRGYLILGRGILRKIGYLHFTKITLTEVDTTVKVAHTPEGKKDEDIKAGDSNCEGLRSEMSEGPAHWCGSHKLEETQITQHERVCAERI